MRAPAPTAPVSDAALAAGGGGQLGPPSGVSFAAGTHAPPSTGTHLAFVSSNSLMTSPDPPLDNRAHLPNTGAGYDPDETFLRVSCIRRKSFSLLFLKKRLMSKVFDAFCRCAGERSR